MATLDQVKRYKVYLTPVVSSLKQYPAYGTEVEITDYIIDKGSMFVQRSGDSYSNDTDFGNYTFPYMNMMLDNSEGYFTDNGASPFPSSKSYFTSDRDLSKVRIAYFDEDDNELGCFYGMIDDTQSVDNMLDMSLQIKVIDQCYILKRATVNTKGQNKDVYDAQNGAGSQLHYDTDVDSYGNSEYDDDYKTVGYPEHANRKASEFLANILYQPTIKNVFGVYGPYDYPKYSIDIPTVESFSTYNTITRGTVSVSSGDLYIQNEEYFDGKQADEVVFEVLRACACVIYTSLDGYLTIRPATVRSTNDPPETSDIKKAFYTYTDPVGRVNCSLLKFNSGIKRLFQNLAASDAACITLGFPTSSSTISTLAKSKEIDFGWLIIGWHIKNTAGSYENGIMNFYRFLRNVSLSYGIKKAEIEFETTKEEMQDGSGNDLELYDLITIRHDYEQSQLETEAIYGVPLYGAATYGVVRGAFSISESIGWKIIGIHEDIKTHKIKVKARVIGESETDYLLS